MAIFYKTLACLCFIAAIALLVMGGIRLYQGFTGHYAYNEAFDDPIGPAIVYVMTAA